MRATWVVGFAVAGTAIAHAGPDDETAKAEAVFRQGRELLKQGKEAEACDRFREALADDHNAIGAMLNVAQCDEKAGKVASAAKLFADARDRAREQSEGDSPLLRAAGDHIAQLTPEIPYLAIAFTEPPTPDTTLTIDHDDVPIAQAGHVPVDPGTVTVVVSRPGRVPYETKVEIGKREQKAIAVPKLAYPVVVDRGWRTAGKELTISGAAALAASVITTTVAKRENADAIARGKCPNSSSTTMLCSVHESDRANKWYTIGNVMTYVGFVGGAAAAGGLYLWLFGSHPAHKEHVSIGPDVGIDHAGLYATGRF
jgi:hypothetical protein